MNTEYKNIVDSLVAEYEHNISSTEITDSHQLGILTLNEQHKLLEKIESATKTALTPTNYNELNAIAREATAHIHFSVAVK